MGAGGGIDDVAVRGTAEDGSLAGGGPTTGKALGRDVQGNGKGAAGGFKKEGARGAAEGVAVWNAYQRGKWVNGQWVPKVRSRRSSRQTKFSPIYSDHIALHRFNFFYVARERELCTTLGLCASHHPEQLRPEEGAEC